MGMNLVSLPALRLIVLRFLSITLSIGHKGGTGIGRHALTAGAQQAVYGQIGYLAGYIPEGDIKGTDGRQRGVPIAVP